MDNQDFLDRLDEHIINPPDMPHSKWYDSKQISEMKKTINKRRKENENRIVSG